MEQQLQAILRGSTATSAEITRLSRSLKTSGEGAAAFASNLGLSVKETANAVTKFRQLEKAGFDNASAFQLMQKETGITAEQFGKLTEGLSSAQVQLDKYKEAQKASASASSAQILALQQLNQSAGNLAKTLVGFVGTATNEFIAYQDALTALDAKLPETIDELGFLEDAIIDVALTTSQSPESAVKAADALVALGASAQEAADRVGTVAKLTDALRTVGATTETAAKAIQLGTSIFEDFGETAESVGDKIAYISDTSAVASSTGLDEFLQLFSKAGGISAQLGINLDELLANFAQLRDAGQAPEVAATSLKSLLSTTLANREELEKLGITIFNVGADGKESFVGLQNLFQQIGERGTTTTEIVDLFGKIGVASAVELSESYDQVAGKIDSLGNSVGALQEKSDAINSSLRGQITLLQGSFQTALTQLGEISGDFVEPVVKQVLKLVNAFIESDPIVKKFVAGIVGIGTVLSGATFALTSYILAIKALQAAKIGLAVETIASTIAIQANTVAQGLNKTVTWEGAKAFVASGIAAASSAVSVTTLSAAFGKLNAALLAVGPALAVLGVGIVGITAGNEIAKTVNELKELNTEVEALGKGSAAQVESVNKVSIGLRDVTAEINSLREKGLDVSDELLDKQKQYIRLGKDSVTDIESEIEARKQVIAAIESGNKGQLDGLGLGKLNKGQQEAILNALNLQVAELNISKGVLERQIDAAGGVKTEVEGTADAQNEVNDELENSVVLANELKETLSRIALDSTNAQAEAYAKFGDNKEALEKRLTEIERSELQQRLKEQVAYLEELKNETFDSEEEKKSAILEAETEIASIRLAINKSSAEERQEQQDAELKAKEEAEKAFVEAAKERIETEKALRKAAYDEEVRQIEALKNAAEVAANERIDAQEAILESLDDQSTAIENQRSLLELQLDTQQTISSARISQLDNEINALGNASKLIDAINSKELDKEELLTAQNELRRLGLDAQSSESEILDVIKQKTIEKSDAEKKALEDRQEGERALLELNQEQERIELQRSLTQARIAEIEAQSLVVQASINAKGEERLLNYYKIQVAAAKAAGASDAELIALEGQVLAQADALALAESQIPLAQTAADLAGQQVDDAERAVEAGEKLFDAQNKNLDAAQAAELAAFNAAENTERVNDALGGAAGGANATADGLERAASAASTTANEIERAVSATESLSKLQGKSVGKPGDLGYVEGFNKRAKEAEEALRDLPGLKIVTTTGEKTKYFVGDKEVSLNEYNAEIQAREDLRKLAGRKIVGQVSAPLSPSDDSYASLKDTVESLERFQQNSRNLISSIGKTTMVKTPKGFNREIDEAIAKSPAGVALAKWEEELRNFFTNYKKESLTLTDELLAEEITRIEKSRDEARKKLMSDNSQRTQDEVEEFTRKWDILTQINNDRLAEKQRQEAAAARASANEEAAIRREIQDIQQKQLTADQIAAEKDLLEFRINNEKTLSEFQLEKLRQRIAALKEVEAINDRIAKQQQLIEGVRLANLPGRALGGPVVPGQAYIVGERRPELFVPRVPGTIVPRVPQASGSGSLARVEALLTQLVARPLPVVNAPATFINQPNPLQTQIELLQGQMRAARSAI